MKSLTIIVPILIAYYFQVTSARSVLESKSNADKWLAMKIEDVNKQCKLNVDYLIDRETYSEYENHFREFMENVGNETFDYTFNNIYNPKLVEALKTLIKRIQDCLDEEYRLDSDNLVEVLGQILNIHAQRVLLMNSITPKEMKMCELLIENKEAFKCIESFDNIVDRGNKNQTVFHVLAGSFVGDSSCEEILPLEECFMKVIRTCSSNARRMFKMLLSPPQVGICENFLNKIDPVETIDMDDIFGTEDYHDSLKRLFVV